MLSINTRVEKKYNDIFLKAIDEFVNNIYNSSQDYSTHHTEVLRLASKNNSWKFQQTILLLKDILENINQNRTI